MLTALQTPGTQIGPDSTMSEVLAVYPGARRALFRRYHIGGCASCGFDETETLHALCRRNSNLDVREVIAYIESSHADDQRILISPSEVAPLLRSETPPRLLDIRTREEWEAVRVQGSTLFTQDVLNEMLMRWPREQLIVIYDHLGTKSMDAAAYFLGHGFQNVRAMRGGIDAWSEQVEPTLRRYRLE